jgi:peptide/nickel transport system substrate-binding protein
MKKNLVKGVALVAVSILGVTGLSLAPASATVADKTVIVQSGNTFSGLNTSVAGKNLVTNVEVTAPTGAGFTYYNNKAQLIRNTAFGTFKITQNTCATNLVFGCFKVTYTIKKGLKYSDGTLITGQDLLLSHAISSSEYSKAAGLGDPGAKPSTSRFKSLGYGGAYDNNVRANSMSLSDDNYSVTLSYSKFMPDWQILGPGPGTVHALVGLAKGKRSIQTARTNATYKAEFENAYYTAIEALPPTSDEDYEAALEDRTAARALLGRIADRWSNSYNLVTINASTNPLLLISNGGMRITACGAESCTLKLNPLASVSGAPRKTGNMETLIFKFPATGTQFSDAAVGQAIKNGEVDLYSGSATSTFWSTVSNHAGTVAARTSVATYEHFDIRTGNSRSVNTMRHATEGACDAPYNGVFKGQSQEAKDLRKAMLLVVPRQEIANTYIGKVFDPGFSGTSPVLNSSFSLTTEGDYSKVVAGSASFVNEFTRDQNTRNAAALALVRKYYPTASSTNRPVKVNMLHADSSRRIDIALRVKLEAAKVGIDVKTIEASNWPDFLTCNAFDMSTFAWSKSAISQTGTTPQYASDGSNNRFGWNDPTLDTLLNRFEDTLSSTQLISAKIAAERQLWSNYWTLQQYQWPGVAAWNKNLKNVLPSPLNPNVTWNYWQLGY